MRVHIRLGPARHGHTPQWGVAAYDRGFVAGEIQRGVRQLRSDRALLALRTPLTQPLSGAALLSPAAAGVFVHECFGHTSEADNYLAQEASADRVLGDRWTAAPLTVRDTPGARPYAGSYREDDEGTPARTVTLLTEGRWTGLLTHRATRRLSGGRSTGHGRGGAGASVPRCSVLDVEPGPYSPTELLRQMGDGWLLGTAVGGYSVRGLLILELLWVRRVRAGQLTDEVLGPAVVCAKKSALAAQVTAVGNDVSVNSSPYTCVKEGHEVGSTLISPSLLLNRCVLRPLDQLERAQGRP
ncbi:metallopeptidase TldD-related protein [Streptomyces sp. NBC_00190]|uniref:metallopeptidase TldD-related protein n=1 Tax=Streptomyces sp. NBC_00190 TaxID=2903634 RepID=UPI002E27F03B|nr:metallopeptidase TldD-related protein [Streptomyces sp. NBC_00190]